MEKLEHKQKFIEKVVPKTIRKSFRWMNFHFSEEGRTIYDFAKTLPPKEKEAVIEQGKDYTTAHSKKNFPRGIRNVTTSLIVGQGMWYFVCPALYRIPEVRESPLGWIVSGGLDKLFVKSDELLFQTGGYSATVATEISRKAAGSVMLGTTALALELATDFSRCYIEYWSQKKYGIVADGAARTYGQARPFFARYSSLEAYQKMINAAVRPWAIGSAGQIYSSVYGILGSIWRTGPQLAIVVTIGKTIDNFLKKIAEWTGLKKLAQKIINEAADRERRAMETIKDIVGERRFTVLQLQLAFESKSMWKWNPFKPAITYQDADKTAELFLQYNKLHQVIASSNQVSLVIEGDKFRRALGECAGRLESILGKKKLTEAAPSFREFVSYSEGGELSSSNPVSLLKFSGLFGSIAKELITKRELE